MARIALNDTTVEGQLNIDTLITEYKHNKDTQDMYKKLCDKQDETIKTSLKELGKTEYDNGEFVAKVTVTDKSTMDEAKLLKVIKDFGLIDCVKVTEYVDMVILEDYLYNHEMTNELAYALDSCKTKKEVTTLRISKSKTKKGEE